MKIIQPFTKQNMTQTIENGCSLFQTTQYV